MAAAPQPMKREMPLAERIEKKLTERFAPVRLRVIDESHKHAGHGGWRPEGETHFRVEIISAAFAGQGRVTRQRMVYEVLAAELAAGVHALQLVTLTPEEEARRCAEPRRCGSPTPGSPVRRSLISLA